MKKLIDLGEVGKAAANVMVDELNKIYYPKKGDRKKTYEKISIHAGNTQIFIPSQRGFRGKSKMKNITKV